MLSLLLSAFTRVSFTEYKESIFPIVSFYTRVLDLLSSSFRRIQETSLYSCQLLLTCPWPTLVLFSQNPRSLSLFLSAFAHVSLDLPSIILFSQNPRSLSLLLSALARVSLSNPRPLFAESKKSLFTDLGSFSSRVLHPPASSFRRTQEISLYSYLLLIVSLTYPHPLFEESKKSLYSIISFCSCP